MHSAHGGEKERVRRRNPIEAAVTQRARAAAGAGGDDDGTLTDPVALEFEVEPCVLGQSMEHVVQEADPGVDRGLARAVQVQRHRDRRLLCLAFDRGSAERTVIAAASQPTIQA